MKRMILAATLASAAVLPGLAEARPADCLVQVEGSSRINGTCDFEAEPNGDFTVTLGGRAAKVMVDPGGREGRAFYEDRGNPAEAPVVGDMRRDGGCWFNPAFRVCAWQPGQRPAAYRNAPAVAGGAAVTPASSGPGARVASSRQVGPWTLSRLEAPGTGPLPRCEVERRYPDGGSLVFMAVPQAGGGAHTGFRFGGAALRGMRGEIRLRPWANVPDMAAVTATADGQGHATLMDPTDEPGSSDAFSNGRVMEVELPGGARLRYVLEGSNAAWRALAQCAGL